MAKKKLPNIILSELFMAKAGRSGWDRCFYGTIIRSTDETGNPVVRGKIKVKDGYIYSMAADQRLLGEKLDELVLMILDMGLHNREGVTSMYSGEIFFLN